MKILLKLKFLQVRSGAIFGAVQCTCVVTMAQLLSWVEEAEKFILHSDRRIIFQIMLVKNTVENVG